MNNTNSDIYEMLDSLSLPVAAQRFAELTQSPEMGNYTPLQLLREVLEPQYTEVLNNRFQTNLRLSSLINKGAQIENLKTGNGRVYNDATVQQVSRFLSFTLLRTVRILAFTESQVLANPIFYQPAVWKRAAGTIAVSLLITVIC